MKRSIKALCIIIIPLAIGVIYFHTFKPPVKVHFLATKEGEAIIIQTAGTVTLVDTASILDGMRLLDYLKSHRIKSLDYLIITHPHPDHFGGVFFILPRFKIKRGIYDNGQSLEGINRQDVYRWYEKIFCSRPDYRILKSGDTITLEKDVVLKVIWPNSTNTFADFNANSLVMMLEAKGLRILLTGDADMKAEAEIIRKGINLKTDILKVGHHGADDATSEEFLKLLSPKTAIICPGKANPNGYPSSMILDRLKINSISVYRTDMKGDILLKIYKNATFRVEPNSS